MSNTQIINETVQTIVNQGRMDPDLSYKDIEEAMDNTIERYYESLSKDDREFLYMAIEQELTVEHKFEVFYSN